jgi:hypothetical protein
MCLVLAALLCGSEEILSLVCQSRRRVSTDNLVDSMLRSWQRVSRAKTIGGSMYLECVDCCPSTTLTHVMSPRTEYRFPHTTQ